MDKDWKRVLAVVAGSSIAFALSAELLRKKKGREGVKVETIFDFTHEWDNFKKRHPLFLERFPNLITALNTTFIRTATLTEPIDKFVFLYGQLCCEELFEVLSCCTNGCGSAALKLVRSLYEKAVTLRYLHEHPDELRDFWDYHHVTAYKLLVPISETLREGTVPEEMRAKVTAKYEEVRERFMVTDCKTCGTRRLNHTWSKLDFVSMAKQSGEIGMLRYPAYYVPLRHTHATVGSLLSRLEDREIEGVSFLSAPQRKEADEALMSAQNIIFQVLKVQEEHFKLPGLAEQVKRCEQDFVDMHS
jgi:hypothetical protein